MKPFYLRNEDRIELEPIPRVSKIVATVIATTFLIGIVWFLCSCANMEMPSGLPLAEHIETAADGP